jgi:hypothetical protein
MKEILAILADNQILLDEVKLVFKKHFALDDIGTTFDNETLGQMVRARVDGLKKVEAAFKEIENCKSVKDTVGDVKNPAR